MFGKVSNDAGMLQKFGGYFDVEKCALMPANQTKMQKKLSLRVICIH